MLNVTKRRTPSEAAPHQHVKILHPVTYAREEFARGRLVVVDHTTAEGWIRDGIAELATEPAPLWPRCPQCGTQFAIAPDIPAGRWIGCPSPRCGGGWIR